LFEGNDQHQIVTEATFIGHISHVCDEDLQSCKAHLGMGQNLVPLVNIKIAGKWMFIPLKMVSSGIDPYPFTEL
jgi:hypothetical protein